MHYTSVPASEAACQDRMGVTQESSGRPPEPRAPALRRGQCLARFEPVAAIHYDGVPTRQAA